MSGPILVLGAGCAGLSAARRLRALGAAVIVVEAENNVGGLAGGVRVGPDVYEYGPHIFHTTDAEILADIKKLMGPELLEYQRTIRIKFLGAWFNFPLSIADVLGKLPPTTTLRAAFSFLWHAAAGLLHRPEIENTETILRREYGDVLYRLFFKDYIQKVWGIPPSAFSASFARERIPRLNILEIVDKAVSTVKNSLRPSRSVSTQGFVEKVEGDLYTTRRGFSLICDRMAEALRAQGAQVRLRSRVVGLRLEGRRVAAVEIETEAGRDVVPCSGIVNTLPINSAALLFMPGLGSEVAAAAAKLRFRAIVFVGLKIRRPKVLPASFVYFREHAFNRVTDLSYFKFKMDPPESTLIVAEIACDVGDEIWRDEAAAREAALADLEREALIAREEIIDSVVYRTAHGQPMYTLGYEDALKTVLGAFESLSNAATAGRQGRFAYVNTHVAMKMGIEAADRLYSKIRATI
ncbi:MAG: FAD-dependent oxidoreductase [Elusimicrobiota bacterium]